MKIKIVISVVLLISLASLVFYLAFMHRSVVADSKIKDSLNPDESSAKQLDVKQTPEKTGESELAVTAELATPRIVLHQPVILNFTINNNSGNALQADLGQDFKENFLFMLKRPNGKTEQLPQLTHDGFSVMGIVRIEPRHRYMQRVLLNEWTGFAETGEYVVEGRLKKPLEWRGSALQSPSEFRITFTIEPEDSTYLRTVAGQIYDRLKRSESYAEIAEAGLELTYFDSADVTPYLKNAVLLKKGIDSLIVQYLRTRGGRQALEVLAFVLDKKPRSTVAVEARNALDWIEHNTRDEDLKRDIQTLLRKQPET